MKKFVITEEEKKRIIGLHEKAKKKVLSEASVNPENVVTNMDFNTLWKNFPNAKEEEIFPGIFPKQYEKSPGTFQNACATRLCLALIKMGVECGRAFMSEKDWTFNGITYPTKGKNITTGAKSSIEYLKTAFGPPTIDLIDNTPENIEKYFKSNKGIFVITNNPQWPGISGHADIFNEKGKCGHACYHGSGGKITAWFFGNYNGKTPPENQQQNSEKENENDYSPDYEIKNRYTAIQFLVKRGGNEQRLNNFPKDSETDVYLITWAKALEENKPVFKYGDVYYYTVTGGKFNSEQQEAASKSVNYVSPQPIMLNR